MAVVALAALIVEPDDSLAAEGVSRPVFEAVTAGGETGDGTRQTTSSMMPPSGVTSLKRVMSLAFIVDNYDNNIVRCQL